MMNTFQSAKVLMKDPFTEGSFSGVYACDELTSIEINEYPKSFVVNTDPMELPGTHWVAIYFKVHIPPLTKFHPETPYEIKRSHAKISTIGLVVFPQLSFFGFEKSQNYDVTSGNHC